MKKPFLGEVNLPPNSDVAITITEETITEFSNVKGIKYKLVKLHEAKAQIGKISNTFGSFDLKIELHNESTATREIYHLIVNKDVKGKLHIEFHEKVLI